MIILMIIPWLYQDYTMIIQRLYQDYTMIIPCTPIVSFFFLVGSPLCRTLVRACGLSRALSWTLRLVQSMLGAFLTASDAFDSMDQEITSQGDVDMPGAWWKRWDEFWWNDEMMKMMIMMPDWFLKSLFTFPEFWFRGWFCSGLLAPQVARIIAMMRWRPQMVWWVRSHLGLGFAGLNSDLHHLVST